MSDRVRLPRRKRSNARSKTSGSTTGATRPPNRSLSVRTPCRFESASMSGRSYPALNTTTIRPLSMCLAKWALSSSSTSFAGRPWNRACSVVIPWTLVATSGIGTPGSASQAVTLSASPGKRSTRAAVTTLSRFGEIPVVSVSNPSQGACVQEVQWPLEVLGTLCLAGPTGTGSGQSRMGP